MTSSERVAAFLAHANIVDALHDDVAMAANGGEIHVVALLSDVASLSEQYIPTLQFLMRPDNCASTSVWSYLHSHCSCITGVRTSLTRFVPTLQ